MFYFVESKQCNKNAVNQVKNTTIMVIVNYVGTIGVGIERQRLPMQFFLYLLFIL